MYVGIMREINQTPGAVKITVEGRELDGRNDRTVYLPKSKIEIRKRKTAVGEFEIFIPKWLIEKNRIDWYRIREIEPVFPGR